MKRAISATPMGPGTVTIYALMKRVIIAIFVVLLLAAAGWKSIQAAQMSRRTAITTPAAETEQTGKVQIFATLGTSAVGLKVFFDKPFESLSADGCDVLSYSTSTLALPPASVVEAQPEYVAFVAHTGQTVNFTCRGNR